MKIKEITKQAIDELNSAKIENPGIKARNMLAFVLNQSKEYILIHEGEMLLPEQINTYRNNIKKLCEGIPFQYITKHQEFMKLDLYVDDNVLIPRQDTEILVEECIKYAKPKDKILDIGTGSGAISIALATYIPNSKLTGADISKKALAVAKKNALQHKVDITWIWSDMFEKIEGIFDIIVSNPPYIETKVMDTLKKQVKREPNIALDGGVDGLNYYRILINQAPKYLRKNGYLLLEIGYNQKEKVMEIITENERYCEYYCKQDLGAKDRVIVCRVK